MLNYIPTELLDVTDIAETQDSELEAVKASEALIKTMVNAEITAQSAALEARAKAVLESAEATASKLLAMIGSSKPKVVGIKINEQVPVILASGRPHSMLPIILREISAGQDNIGLTGPRGSGKTTLAKQVAEALRVPFGFISVTLGMSEAQLFGRWTPANTFAEAPLWSMLDKPGVFLLDELDCGDPNTLLAANAIMANGMAVNPYTGEQKRRHQGFVIIGAMNTTGRGASAEYNARVRLDAATLDRLSLLEVDYDTELESEILSNSEIRGKLWAARERLRNSRSKETLGTRAIVRAAKYLATGFSEAEIYQRLTVGWDSASVSTANLISA